MKSSWRICEWCLKSFRRKKHGRSPKFCSRKCWAADDWQRLKRDAAEYAAYRKQKNAQECCKRRREKRILARKAKQAESLRNLVALYGEELFSHQA